MIECVYLVLLAFTKKQFLIFSYSHSLKFLYLQSWILHANPVYMTKKIHLVGIPLYQILPTVTKFLQWSSKKKAVYLQRSGSPTIAKNQTEWKGEMGEMSLLAHDRINCNLIIVSMFSPQVTKIVLRSTRVECIPLFCKSCTKLPSSRYFCNPCEFYLKGNFYLSNVQTHSELVEDISLIHSKYFCNSSLNHCQPIL